jgi:hypothetical protein
LSVVRIELDNNRLKSEIDVELITTPTREKSTTMQYQEIKNYFELKYEKKK